MSDTRAAPRAALFWLPAIALALAAFVYWNDPLRWALIRLEPLGAAAVFVAACAGIGWIVRAPDLLTSAAIGCGIVGALSFAATLAIAVLAVIVALIIPFVAAPDVSTDALEYHLLVPKLIIQQNAIHHQPLLVESNYPSLAEYDFIPLLILGDNRVAKAFHFLCAILLLFAIARLASPNGVLAAAIFVSMPVVALTAGWAWNDMLFTLFVVLSLVHLIEGRFVLAGVLFGFATWTKYTFVLAAVAVAAILIRGLVQRWWRVRDVVRFAVPVAIIAAIWMTKNAVLTGNPVYPFLNGVFHSPFWTAASEHYFHGTLTRYEIPRWHWWTYFAFPMLLALKPRVIDVQTGLLPLVLLPLVFVRMGTRWAAIVRTYIVAIVIAWLFVHTEARSLLSLFAVLSAIYAVNIERLRGWRGVVGVAVALNVVILMVTTNVVTDPIRYFLGLESPAQYIVRMDPRQDVYRWIDAQPDAREVLLVGLHDPFYLHKPAIFSSCCDTPVAQTVNLANLKAAGITHIAFRSHEYARENAAGLYTWSPAQKTAFENFLRQRCRLVARIGDVLVFRLM